MTKEEHDALLQLWGSQFNLDESASPYAPPGEGKRWANKDKVKNIDGMQHAIFVEHNAIVLGIPKDIELIHAGMTWEDEEKAARAKLAWARIPQQFKERAGFVTV